MVRVLVICMCVSDGNEKEKKCRRWGLIIDMVYYEGLVVEVFMKLKIVVCGVYLLDLIDDWN